MLEVCFSDSMRGSLIFAQRCRNNGIGGATSVTFLTDSKWPFSYFEKRKALKDYKKRQIELQKQAVPLGGRVQDTVGLYLQLSEGNIKAPILCDDCMVDLEKLKSNPDEIRIWVDRTPDVQCGLLFVADLLKNSETEIHVVELPERIERDDNIVVEYSGWHEVMPELYGTFLDRERILSKDEIDQLSQRWQELKEENAPLRVLENGVVINADESYYDDLIRSEFPKESCRVANIIGNALSKILKDDVFIAKRIQHFIDEGELVVVDGGKERFFDTVVRCNIKKAF